MVNPLQNLFPSTSSLQPGNLLAYLKTGGNPADPVFQAPGQKKP